MSCVCLWSPRWPTGGEAGDELTVPLLEVVPRVVVERRGVVWADVRGLPAVRVAGELVDRLGVLGVEEVRAGISAVPVAAEMAARGGGGGGVRAVEVGKEREFVAPFPLQWLEPEPRLAALFAGVGLVSLGDLAALSREAVEVRFGPEAVGFWRLSRADDRRRLFGPIPAERPRASIDFVDYVVTDPERLVFTANALLGSLEEALRSRGEHARRVALVLSLADGRVWRRILRPARPTASREVWLRLVRAVLEQAELPDAVAGVAFQVEATEAAAVRQGDLFDRGFATAAAVEAAIVRLIEAQGSVFVEPDTSGHPLPERRISWVPGDPLASVGGGAGKGGRAGQGAGAARGKGVGHRARVSGGGSEILSGGAGAIPVRGAAAAVPLHGAVPPPGEGAAGAGGAPGAGAPPGARLTLQLLPEPRPVEVEVVQRRDHVAPVRYHDGREWRQLVTAAGPDRVSGGRWELAYAREYFRCVTAEGVLVWLFRDARRGGWYLHGWWD
ncbi:MAG TPA: hypothetical protein VF158_05185 [Longimicrobiales bacterium]